MKQRRSRSKPYRNKHDAIDPMNIAALHCRNIATIAELLEACGRVTHAEPLKPKLVAYVGAMISDEARRLQNLLTEK